MAETPTSGSGRSQEPGQCQGADVSDQPFQTPRFNAHETLNSFVAFIAFIPILMFVAEETADEHDGS